MEDNTYNFDNNIYAVAVGAEPGLWTIHCEICNLELHEGTNSDTLLEKLESLHKQFHSPNTSRE